MSIQLQHENFCPKCGKTLDGVSAVSEKETPEPVSGDVSVCLYCFTMLQFDDDIKSQILTPDEFLALEDDVRLELTRAVKAMIEVRENGEH